MELRDGAQPILTHLLQAAWRFILLWVPLLTLGGQGRGDGLVTTPVLPVAAATSFLAAARAWCAASAAAQGAAAVGSVAFAALW